MSDYSHNGEDTGAKRGRKRGSGGNGAFPGADERALEIMQLPPGSRDEDTLVDLMFPLADERAKAHAKRCRGKSHAPQLDYDAFLSHANEGLRQMIQEHEALSPDATPSECRSLFATVMERRIADWERQVIGWRNPKPHTNTLTYDPPAASDDDHAFDDPEREVDLADMKTRLLKRFAGVFGPETRQYKTLAATVEYEPLGYVGEEIAQKLGVSPNVYYTSRWQARRTLEQLHPELEKDLKILLGQGPRSNGRDRF